MTVRDQDRRARRPHPGELEPQLRGIAARIDDDRLRRTARGADDVTVRLDRTKRIRVDGESHRASVTRHVCGQAALVQHWNLNETPAAQPAVLHSRDGEGRVVLLALAPGQELGEHKVKEGALILVIDGDARVEAGNEFGRAPHGDDRRRRTPAARARPVAGRGALPRRGRGQRFGVGTLPRACQRRYAKRSRKYVNGTKSAVYRTAARAAPA